MWFPVPLWKGVISSCSTERVAPALSTVTSPARAGVPPPRASASAASQRSRCIRGLLDLVQPVRPAPAEMVRDRKRLRDRNLVRVVLAGGGAGDHLADFPALEPA